MVDGTTNQIHPAFARKRKAAAAGCLLVAGSGLRFQSNKKSERKSPFHILHSTNHRKTSVLDQEQSFLARLQRLPSPGRDSSRPASPPMGCATPGRLPASGRRIPPLHHRQSPLPSRPQPRTRAGVGKVSHESSVG